MRILHDIHYIPDFLAMFLVHQTLPNGRNVVGTVGKNVLNSPKTFISLNGLSSDDFTFKIGNTSTTLNDANNTNWSIYPVLSWATFSILPITAGTKIRISYIGDEDLTDLVSSFICNISEAPLSVATNLVFSSSKIAANDILLGFTNTTSITNVISEFTTNKFSAKRTDLEIADSSLTNFVSNLTALTNLGTNATGHLFAEPTTTNRIGQLSIQTTSADASLGNIIGIASPLSNDFYPVTGDGVNPLGLKKNAINDQIYVPSGVTGADLLYLSNMSVGEERSYTWLASNNAVGIYYFDNASILQEYMRCLGLSNFVIIQLDNQLLYQFANTGAFSENQSPVNYVTYTVRRNALDGSASVMYTIELYINSKKVQFISSGGSVGLNEYVFSTKPFYLGMLNGLFNNPLSNAFRNQGLRFFTMHKRILNVEEIKRLHLGQDVSSFLPNYYYDFTNLQLNVPDDGNRRIPNLGSDVIDDARLENHTNILSTLF